MILAIETSDALCGICIYDEGRSLMEYRMEMPRLHAELVGRFVEEGLHFLENQTGKNRRSIDDIELVSVALGPGSFTGLRIGLSFAQGFCSGRDIPIVGISNHQVLADRRPVSCSRVLTIIEARRGEVYLAEHRLLDKNYSEIENHQIVSKDVLADRMDGETALIIHSGIQLTDTQQQALSRQAGIFLLADYSPNILARLGHEKLQRIGPDDLDTIDPLYIRPFAGTH